MSKKNGIAHYFFYLAQGGACGLLNLLWLQEIEKQTRMHVAYLADFIAAASVGAIHAGALTLRDRKNPEKPAFSAAEYYGIFKQDLPDFLPHDPGFFTRQVLLAPFHALGKMAPRLFGKTSNKTHYSTEYPEKRLRTIFHDVAVGDALTGLAISAHRIKPPPAMPCDFICLPQGTDPKKFYKTLHPGDPEEDIRAAADLSMIPLHQAIMASIVCPMVFPSHEIPECGVFTDVGGVNNPSGLVESFRASLPPEDTLRVVWLGTGSLERTIDPAAYNRNGFLETINPMTEMFSMHTARQALSAIRRAVGPENVTIIDTQLPGKRDILDTSPAGIARLEAAAQEAIHQQPTQFRKLADDLGTAFLYRAQPLPDAAFLRTSPPPEHPASSQAAFTEDGGDDLFYCPLMA